MKTAKELTRELLPTAHIMQLATARNDQPWLCAVHFVSDNNLNLYWVSEAKRRHSQELTNNNNTAAYVTIHENTKDEDYVIGIALEGTTEEVKASEYVTVCEAYATKHHSSEAFKAKILAGTIPLYRFTPTNIVMFNNRDFKEHPRQEFKVA